MRVMLVNANQSRDLLPPPPVGLAYVAEAARSAGHDVVFLDLLASRRPLPRLRRAVRRHAPSLVGLSVRNIDNVTAQRCEGQLAGVAEQIAVIRAETRAPIVLGGAAVSLLGGDALTKLDADFAGLGDGEQIIGPLLAELGGARRFDAVPGLCFRADGVIVANPPARPRSFGDSRLDRWVDWGRYERGGGTWPIQSKRGCSHRCVYCPYPAIEGAELRFRPAEEVVDEIERVARTVAPRCFEIIDSTFNVPIDHALALCEAIIRRGLEVRFTATAINPGAVSAELFELMRRAGFVAVMITPESASDATLAALRKGFTRREVVHTAELAAAAGIPTAWFFLLGGPEETEATANETVSFMEEQLSAPHVLSIVTTGVRVLPGTELARTVVSREGAGARRDFTAPVFYFSPHVRELWLLQRVNRAIRAHPNIVHTAEERRGVFQDLYFRFLHRAGVAPPYWRFLPRLLALPPIRAVRGRRVSF